MEVKFSDIDFAFHYVSSSHLSGCSVVLDRFTGKFYYSSDFEGIDEIPEDLWDTGDPVEIPYKNDLGLGKKLVFEFIYTYLPDNVANVRDIFSRQGAYSRYKGYLNSKGLLETWFEFEEKNWEAAIRNWARENDIEIVDE